jgi:hypothetical protein
MKQYLNILLSLFLTITSCQPAFAQTKVDGSLLKGDVIGGTASNTRRIVVPKDTKSNLDAKTRLEANLVYGTDTKKAYIDNGTDLIAVGSGSGGAVNLITDGDAENATSSIFIPYNDAAASRPVDGVGSSADVTTAITSTAPLTGAKSFTITKDAVNRQGQGWSIPFTVPLSMQAKVLQIEVDYIVNSGTFVAGSSSADSDIIWYLYDVTNSTLIEPSSIKMLASSTTLSDKFRSTFQTSATGTSYRLIAHVATTSAAAYTLKVEASVSPSVYVYGTPITDWQSYTTSCSGTWTTNTTYSCKKRRAGDSYEYQYDLALTGAPTATNLSLNLPSGDVIDTSKLVSASVGVSHIPNSGGKAFDGVSAVHNLASVYGATTAVMVIYESTATGQIANVTQAAPFTFNSGDTIQVSFAVPIVGLSSSVQMSDSADTRILAAKYTLAVSTSITSGSPINFATKVEDTHGAVTTGAAWKFTAPISGLYSVTALQNANGAHYYRVYKNGVADDYLSGAPASNYMISGKAQIRLNAGEYIDVRPDASVTTQSVTYITIEKIQGPSAIAANESINLRYTNTAGTSIANSGDIVVPFVTRDFDSHGSWVTDTFTAQTSGKYEVNAKLSFASATYAAGNRMVASIYKNGSFYTYGAYVSVAGAATMELGVSINDTVSMLAGDTLQIRVSNNRTAGATAIGTSGNSNSVNIKRIGN